MTAAAAATHTLDAEREQLLAEIREANLTYLMLAQRLIRADKAEATFRLGLSETAADLIAALTPAQIVKLASQNTLLCRFQDADDIVWKLLTSSHAPQRSVGEAAQRLHASILMAGRLADTAA
jgi:flagellar transcriptional activator FlhD